MRNKIFRDDRSSPTRFWQKYPGEISGGGYARIRENSRATKLINTRVMYQPARYDISVKDFYNIRTLVLRKNRRVRVGCLSSKYLVNFE